MDPVVAFLRAYPQTSETVCTEPVLAWLAQRGLIEGLSARRQRRLFDLVGFKAGVEACVARLGLVLERPDDLLEGDAVVARDGGDSAIVGLVTRGGLVAAASFGCITVAPLRPILVARKAHA